MASFLDRLFGRPDIERQPTASSVKATYGDGWLTAYQQGGIPLSDLSTADPQAKAARLLQAYTVGWFNKAERKISTDFSSLELSLAPENTEGDNQDAEVEPDLLVPWDQLDPIGRFLRLMEKPNEFQTGRQLRQKTMIRLDMAGWAFWYTELGSDGMPVENGLFGISPARLWPSYDKTGRLIGYVLDRNRQGGGIPFEVEEIIPFSYASAQEDMVYGVGVVEAVWAQVPLTDLMAKHTADVLSMGGRLAGSMWPKNRALDEDEFLDAQRAWRSVASDPNAARRLLIFPEPMEWSATGSTPTEIGIPELAALNRDDILTSFPISPYQLGVPVPGGLNSGETRKQDRLEYWQGTIHPRVELFEEVIQSYLVPKYEAAVGYTLDFEVAEPSLDDAEALVAKVGAFDALTAAGFDDTEAVAAVGLDHIKYVGKPTPPPPPTVVAVGETPKRGLTETTSQPVTTSPSVGGKAFKSAITERNAVTEPATVRARARLERFFIDQRSRVTQAMRVSLPSTKAERRTMKSDPTWWDAKEEDDELTATMREVYADVGQGGLQTVSNTLGRVIVKGAVQNVIADLLRFGGQRIADINERTLQALVVELAEGTRRGYSITQLIEGVPAEGYRGIDQAGLDNGIAVWSDTRAETIARTETEASYLRSTVTGYGEFGITTLLAYDGDQDELCADRDGQEYSIEDAANEDEHPNGTLVWSPVVDKSYHETPDPLINLTERFLEAIKSMQQPTPVYITNEAPRAADVHVSSPDVRVTSPDVHVHVPETAPVAPPVVNVTTPDVTVNVPKSEPVVNVKAPVVNVKADMPAMNVTIPAELSITSMPDRVTERRVERDKAGLIKRTVDIETDG